MSKLKLTCFDKIGRSEGTRLLFQVGGIPFEDERLSMEQFIQYKQAGRFKYGQLPVLEVDGVQYAQTDAIFRFAANKAGLYPTDETERLLADEMLANFTEIKDGFIPTIRIQDEQELKKARENFLNNTLLKWLNILNIQLEKTGTGFYIGNKLSAVDIYSFVLFGWFQSGMQHIPSDCAKQFEYVQKNYDMVQSHPKIQEWLQKHPPKAQ